MAAGGMGRDGVGKERERRGGGMRWMGYNSMTHLLSLTTSTIERDTRQLTRRECTRLATVITMSWFEHIKRAEVHMAQSTYIHIPFMHHSIDVGRDFDAVG